MNPLSAVKAGKYVLGTTIGAKFAGDIFNIVKDVSGNAEEALDASPEYKRKLDIAVGNSFNLKELFLESNKRSIVGQNKAMEEMYQQSKNPAVLTEYYNRLRYLSWKTGVTLKPPEMKRAHLDTYVGLMKNYGVSKDYAKALWFTENKMWKAGKDAAARISTSFDTSWNEKTQNDSAWDKANAIGMGLVIAGHGGGMAVPILQPLGFLGDAIIAASMIRDITNFHQIDKIKATGQAIYGAGMVSALLSPLKGVRKLGSQSTKYFSNQLYESTMNAHSRASNAWEIDMSKLTQEANRAAEISVNAGKSMISSLGDHYKAVGNFNALLAGQVMEREKAGIISSAFGYHSGGGASKEYLRDIVFNVNRYKDVINRGLAGEKLSNLEQLAFNYADFSFTNKLSNDLHEISHRVSGRIQGDVKASFSIRKWDELGATAETVFEAPVDFRRLRSDGEHFYDFKDAAKNALAKKGDFGVLEIEIPVKTMKDEPHVLKYTRTYNYPYTPLQERGIIASIERDGVQRLKFIPQAQIKEGVDELRSWGYNINKIYSSEGAVKSSLEQALKTVLDLSPEKLQSVIAEGEEGLRGYIQQAIRDARTLKGLDTTKIKPFTDEHLKSLGAGSKAQGSAWDQFVASIFPGAKKGVAASMKMKEEAGNVMDSLLSRSVSRSLLYPYNNKLLQLNEYLGKMVTPETKNTVAGYMKNVIDSIYDPNFYKKSDINQILRSTWVAYNVPIIIANHIQSVFVGYLKAAQQFGAEGVKDWIGAYGKAIAGKGGTYKGMAENMKTALITAPSKRNGFDMLRGIFYQMEPFSAIEEATIKNFISKKPDYTKAFGLVTSDKDVAAHAGRDVLQFMSMLETPFAEARNPKMFDWATSFYRYMARPATTMARAMLSKKGALPAIVGITSWATLFGAKSTPFALAPQVLSLFSKQLEDEAGEEGMQKAVLDFFDGVRQGIIPDEAMPAVLLAFGEHFKNEIVSGKGMVGKLLRETTGSNPSFTTLGFAPDAPHASPALEAVLNFARQTAYLRTLKTQVDQSPAGQADQTLGMLLNAAASTVGFVKRVSSKQMASGYGVDMPLSVSDIVTRTMFPRSKYVATNQQDVPVSVKNIDLMAKMTSDPGQATEVFMSAVAKDPTAKDLFVANSNSMLRTLDSRIHSMTKKAPMIQNEQAKSLAKTIGMIAAWRSALGDLSPSEAAGAYMKILNKYGAQDSKAFLSFYYDVLEQAQYFKNTLKKTGRET